MEDKPIRDERIVEAIEACRPGSDDVSDPALALLAAKLAAHPELDERYERCQQLDARLAAAFADVPLPDGLGERILAAVRAAQRQAVGEPEEPLAAPPDEPAQPLSPRSKRRFRRWFAGIAVAAGLAASLLIAIAHFQAPSEMSRQEVLGLAIDYFSRESEEPSQPGELLTADNEPRQYRFSRSVNNFAETTFRHIRGFLGRGGVAYDMTSPAGVAATLYVVSADEIEVTGLPVVPPPFREASHTRGCSSAAWQSDGLVYVLVIRGDSKRTYDSFLPIPGPVT